jgi:hypothetical protein
VANGVLVGVDAGSYTARMLYELRIYECVPGRLPALHDRFRTTTMRKFGQHGIDVVGFWVDKYGISNRLTYMLRWESEADRERKWGAFTADPEWLAARAASEAPEHGGPIVARVINTMMTATDYSPLR